MNVLSVLKDKLIGLDIYFMSSNKITHGKITSVTRNCITVEKMYTLYSSAVFFTSLNEMLTYLVGTVVEAKPKEEEL